MDKSLIEGGSGSGNFGHAGRPGQVGGSVTTPWDADEYEFKNYPGPYFFTDRDKTILTQLTREEETSISKWTDDTTQKNLQSYLRYPNQSNEYLDYYSKQGFKETVEHLDKLVKSSEFEKDVLLYRGSENLPDWLEPGVEYVDKGFVSTSTEEFIAKGFSGRGGVVYHIKVPKGTNYLPIHSWNKYMEHEILLGRNTKFRVTGIDFSEQSRIRVALELIP